MSAITAVFWTAAGLLVYAQAGYPVLLWLVAGRRADPPPRPSGPDPFVSFVIAAHDEAEVIGAAVEGALELDYPRGRLEVIVASDGSSDGTVEAAARAGADVVLDLPRGGKVAALNAAVERARGEVLAFADANARWDPSALRRLVARFGDPRVGYVCGRLELEGPAGENQEGLYWRYEMAVRSLESRLAGVTAGNGAINAVRRDAYLPLEGPRGQDISFPFELTKRGWRAVYEPRAVAREPLASSLGSEFRRKRRMLAGAWATILRHGMLSPRGYPAAYAFEIVSHRGLRYVAPVLHVVALAANVALLGRGAVYSVTLAIQAAVLVAAALAPVVPWRAFRIARYYVTVNAAGLAALWDFARGRVPVSWESAR